MKTTVDFYDFRDAFQRFDRADAFTSHGLNILFQGLEEFEEDTGEEMELDVIAICCDFCEMSVQDIQNAYPTLCEDLEDDEKLALDKAIEILSNQTWVLGSTENNTVVFRQF